MRLVHFFTLTVSVLICLRFQNVNQNFTVDVTSNPMDLFPEPQCCHFEPVAELFHMIEPTVRGFVPFIADPVNFSHIVDTELVYVFGDLVGTVGQKSVLLNMDESFLLGWVDMSVRDEEFGGLFLNCQACQQTKSRKGKREGAQHKVVDHVSGENRSVELVFDSLGEIEVVVKAAFGLRLGFGLYLATSFLFVVVCQQRDLCEFALLPR